MKKNITFFMCLVVFVELNTYDGKPYSVSNFFKNAWYGTTTSSISAGLLIIENYEEKNLKCYTTEFKYQKTYTPIKKKLYAKHITVDFITAKDEQKQGKYLLEDISFAERNPYCLERFILFGTIFSAYLIGAYLYDRKPAKHKNKYIH